MNRLLTYIEIDKAALLYNSALCKQHLGQQQLIAVVKANAYGHGLVDVARVYDADSNVAGFMTATLSDGIQLRQAGIVKPIIMMAYYDTDVIQAIYHDISVVVYDLSHISMLESAVRTVQKPINIHVKIDTGLSRFGWTIDHAVDIVERVVQTPGFILQGVASHYAEGKEQDWLYSVEQKHRFMVLLSHIERRIGLPPMVHMSKSATLFRQAGAVFGTHARLGAALYGCMNSEFGLHVPLSWKTKIIALRDLAPQTPVGYSGAFVTDRPTRIALLPIGYYDGYARDLSQKGFVRVACRTQRGTEYRLAPVVSFVAMNVVTIDVTHLDSVALGDEVLLIGDHPGIRPADIARLINTNPRYIVTSIAPHIPRLLI